MNVAFLLTNVSNIFFLVSVFFIQRWKGIILFKNVSSGLKFYNKQNYEKLKHIR